MAFRIGFLLFPDIMQLDMTGPHEVFTKFPDTEVLLISRTLDPVQAGGGMRILPDVTYADCPQLDLVCVPGGGGMNALLTDSETLDFLRRQAQGARYVTSVCTGSLVSGGCGLAEGTAGRLSLDVAGDVVGLRRDTRSLPGCHGRQHHFGRRRDRGGSILP